MMEHPPRVIRLEFTFWGFYAKNPLYWPSAAQWGLHTVLKWVGVAC